MKSRNNLVGLIAPDIVKVKALDVFRLMALTLRIYIFFQFFKGDYKDKKELIF